MWTNNTILSMIVTVAVYKLYKWSAVIRSCAEVFVTRIKMESIMTDPSCDCFNR